eukprot:GHVL01044742.1.p1 GENE.GHVL01044742.1~~GHVL01044742.1.p1  ORF type:complete len:248 (+),score=39.24 GHVL01044742.1:1093-1836(+)
MENETLLSSVKTSENEESDSNAVQSSSPITPNLSEYIDNLEKRCEILLLQGSRSLVGSRTSLGERKTNSSDNIADETNEEVCCMSSEGTVSTQKAVMALDPHYSKLHLISLDSARSLEESDAVPSPFSEFESSTLARVQTATSMLSNVETFYEATFGNSVYHHEKIERLQSENEALKNRLSQLKRMLLSQQQVIHQQARNIQERIEKEDRRRRHPQSRRNSHRTSCLFSILVHAAKWLYNGPAVASE